MKRNIWYAIMLFLVMACEETVDWALKPTENGQLVIDAILTNENTYQEVILSLSFAQLNDEPPRVGGAEVFVSANNTVFPFTENPDQPGHYRSIEPFGVLRNLDYGLTVVWENQSYQAKSR